MHAHYTLAVPWGSTGVGPVCSFAVGPCNSTCLVQESTVFSIHGWESLYAEGQLKLYMIWVNCVFFKFSRSHCYYSEESERGQEVY